MAKKKQHHEEHVDEAWLLPYADMLTLLLALFIVMFAMSEVDKEKLQQAGQQFNTVFSGGPGVLEKEGNSPIPLYDSSISEEQKGIVEQDAMISIKNELEEGIKQNGYEDQVNIGIDKEGLRISIQDTVLFNSGDAQILGNFAPLLNEISSMLKPLANNIRIDGHTDNVPIRNSKYKSNWELSSDRSLNVMNSMIQTGMSPEKFSIGSFGEYKPKYDNSTPEGRAKNRRVEIVVIRKHQIDENKIK